MLPVRKKRRGNKITCIYLLPLSKETEKRLEHKTRAGGDEVEAIQARVVLVTVSFCIVLNLEK